MRNQFLLTITMFGLVMNLVGQTIDLTFTAVDNESYVQLDSIKVMNRTQGGDTMLYWPDTVLSLYVVGINEPQSMESSFQVFQNYPNPVVNQTTITLYVPKKDQVGLMITDILGNVKIKEELMLERGLHSFRYAPNKGNLCFFMAQWRNQYRSIKILQSASNSNTLSALEYIGSESIGDNLKTIEYIQDFTFSLGDELLYIGYADGLQSGLLDTPEDSKLYTFQFATNIPCPGISTVNYEGQIYNTIQIFSQCWLKENLNIGTMIPGTQTSANNGIVEKYCFGNYSDSCLIYGGLYSWWEMMQYNIAEEGQGICPSGWHIPSDKEWKILEGSVDSYNGVGSITWDMWGLRGLDCGNNLKSQTGWYYGGNGDDLYGFSALPGGIKWGNSSWQFSKGYWWSSTEFNGNGAWHRVLGSTETGIERNSEDNEYALSVRCIKD